MRRLRATPQLRELFRETEINPRDLVLPIFVDEGSSDFIDITSMPGVRRIPEAKLAQEVERYARAGLRSVMTFGISHHKDSHGTDTLNPDGLVARMSRIIKDAVPEMVVMSDTCFCEYTDHGHCGILHGDTVDNDSTVLNLGKQAVIAAQAGADIIAPSAAMDGQVAAIRSALDAAGFHDTPVMAYSTKFASGLYGPFRDAAGSTLKGDRKTYQMDPMNRREAIRESLDRRSRRRRCADGETGRRLSGHHPRPARSDAPADRRLPGQRRVRDDQVRRAGGCHRRAPRGAGNPGRHQARGRGHDLYVLRDGCAE